MDPIPVDIASSIFRKDTPGILTASSLGSCIAIAIHSDTLSAGGMAVFMLPYAKNTNIQNTSPYHFCDTGICRFLEDAARFDIPVKSSKIVVAGGAGFLDSIAPYPIGQKNCESVAEAIASVGLGDRVTMAVGGVYNRTISLNLHTGIVSISVWGKDTVII